jgi:hypothetical protein
MNGEPRGTPLGEVDRHVGVHPGSLLGGCAALTNLDDFRYGNSHNGRELGDERRCTAEAAVVRPQLPARAAQRGGVDEPVGLALMWNNSAAGETVHHCSGRDLLGSPSRSTFHFRAVPGWSRGVALRTASITMARDSRVRP